MSKWVKQLRSYEDLVKTDYDAFAPENCIYTPSPYVNWIFANKSHGLPKGCGLLLYSEPKAGKSLMIQAAIQELHTRDPEAIAIVFNTEMRGFVQSGLFRGIDKDRLIMYDTNRPEAIFDRLEQDIEPMIQEGMPLGLVAIDSLTMIGGTKSLTGGRSVNDHLIGDKALTVTKGLEKIIPIFKKHKIPYIATDQLRSNVDASNPRAPKEKAASIWMTKHTFEYFVTIKKANAAADREGIDGEAFVNADVKDARGNKDITGHKIYFKMDASSIGTPGRSGVLTVDYKRGIINQHEEIFNLGYNTGVIQREGVSKYVYGADPETKVSIVGKANFAKKIQEDVDLARSILNDVKAKDAEQNETKD